MENAPQFMQEPETRGFLGEQQSAQQAWKHWQEIIYLSFIPSVLSLLLLLHFINFHSCSLICFPFTGDLVQGEIPNPSHEQQEQKDLCLGSVVQTNTSLGVADSCPCSLQRKSSSVFSVLVKLCSISPPDLSELDFTDRSFNTNSVPNGSIHIWNEDLGKKREQSKR